MKNAAVSFGPSPSRAQQRRELLRQRPWERMDPNADPTRGVNVRVNDYELAIFQVACGDVPLQRVARRQLRTWAEQQLGIGVFDPLREQRKKELDRDIAVLEEQLEDMKAARAALEGG